MRRFLKHIILCVVVLCLGTVQAQTRKQLETQRKKLKAEITKVNQLLIAAKKKKSNALEDLKDLNQKIDVRTKLIATINLEAKALSKEISTQEEVLQKLDKKLKALKADYAEMIFKSYKSKSQQSRMMFLLSSQNFYQAYKRLQYMKQYASFRKKQGEEIIVETEKIARLKDSLQAKKKAKDTLLVAENQQKELIETDKKRQETLVSSIKKQERKYKRDLTKKQKEEKRIAARIDKMIRDAIARSNKNRKKGTKRSKGFILSPEAKALAAKFEQNKGKLPWPVKEGLITRRYGVQPHPTIGGITINSTGVHFATRKGFNALCVFNGKVLGVQSLPGGKRSVLVQHGNYITVYNNLESVYVKKGDRVNTGQNLGKIFTNKVTGKTKLIFVLFKNTKRLNPSRWMLKG